MELHILLMRYLMSLLGLANPKITIAFIPCLRRNTVWKT